MTPSAPSFSSIVRASCWPTSTTACRSSAGMSRRSVACSRGITSRWPRVPGLMSMNAIVRSSSWTRVEGTSPATILQNRQSGSAAIDGAQGTSLRRSMPADTARLRATVEHLASFDRPSASDGERRAAEWIRGELEALGVAGAGRGGVGRRLDGDPARRCCRPPGCWRRSGGRRLAPLGLLAAAGIVDDVSGGPQRLPPPAQAPHDLQRRRGGRRSGCAGDAGVRRAPRRRAGRADLPAGADPPGRRHVPGLVREADDLAADAAARRGRAGARRDPRPLRKLGLVLSAGSLLAFGDIATRTVVPGANDNLTAVAVLLELARLLREKPVEGVRVLLVSTGSEESFMEGMRGWVRRHGPALDRERTRVDRARDARLAGADPARGRGDDLDDRLRPRGARLHRRVGAGRRRPAAARAEARLRHRRAVGAARRGSGPPRSPPATSTRCRPTTTRSATSRATSTSRRWRRARGSPRRRSGEQRAREADRVLAGADLARVLRLLELGHQPADLLARARPARARARRRARAAPAAPRGGGRAPGRACRARPRGGRRSRARRSCRAWRGGRRR